MLVSTLRWAAYLVILIGQIVGFLLFLRGFFPSKVVLDGFSHFENASPFLNDVNPHFSKVILMVVDAMRADFLYDESTSHMLFVHELLRKGEAIGFDAFSNPPTVTLPRLKGITTGNTPNFLDAILNIADDQDDTQSLANQDSWLYQFKATGDRKLHFFGDDTWLKLFPPQQFFEEYEGTSSFFVSDFTEVDNNVTRHLDTQLDENAKWDGLILHYLGLDHIGHKGGPRLPFMKPKQLEMDSIIERLYAYSLLHPETLLVVMGDHGMNEVGNHGGSSEGETSSGMLFVSPKFSKISVPFEGPIKSLTKINQIDLVPTLAALLNFPIPRNSIGVIIPEFLRLWKSPTKVLKLNVGQFVDLLKAKFKGSDKFDENTQTLLDQYSTSNDLIDGYKLLRHVQDELMRTATDYNYDDIWAGAGAMVFSTILAIAVYNIYFFKISQGDSIYALAFEGFVFLFSIHVFGSSLIEEEHQIWWFIATVTMVLFLLSYKNIKKDLPWVFLVLVSMRIIRQWNNTGQKHIIAFPISRLLLDHPQVLWWLNTLTILLYTLAAYGQGSVMKAMQLGSGKFLNANDVGHLFLFVFTFVNASVLLLFKLSQYHGDGNELPKGVFKWFFTKGMASFDDVDYNNKLVLQGINIQLSHLTIYCFGGLLLVRLIMGKLRKTRWGYFTDIANLSTFILIHYSRPEVIPIYSVFFVAKFAFSKLLFHAEVDQLLVSVTWFTMIMQNLSFFSIGGTNLLATVDLSNAYNGVGSYNVFLVGILTFVSNFATPIYWSLSSLQFIFEKEAVQLKFSAKPSISLARLRFPILLVKSMISLLFYCVFGTFLVLSCINLRFHLFIWTVFSPKLLYFGVWFVLINTLTDLVLPIVMFILY